MPVTYLEIENFKSYAGIQTVGPFRDFTSVIGPNGSGKSNLMDAISFVLGVQSRDLRSSQMKDLIFRPPGTSVRRQTLRARVTLYFQSTREDDDDTHDSDSCDNDEEEIAFARAINHNGHGEYIINGKTVTFAKYEERLAAIGVLVKARNFLVFQGDVESIARKTPKEMVQLLEQISTSSELAGDYDEALKAKEAAESAVAFEFNRTKSFKSERRLLKEQKEEAERFQELLKRRTKLQTDLYLWQLFLIDSDIKEQEDSLKDLRQEVEEKEQDEELMAQALKEAKRKASAARRKTQNVDKNRVKCAAAAGKLEPQMIETMEEIKSLKKKIVMAEKQLAKKRKEAKNHSGNLETLNQQTQDQQKKLEVLEQDYEAIKKDAVGNSDTRISLTEEQEEELERIKQAAAAATVQSRRTAADLNRKLNRERAIVAKAIQDLEESRKALAQAQMEAATSADRNEKLSKSLEGTRIEIQEKEKELLEAQKSLQESQARREELDREIEKISKTLRDAKDSCRKCNDEERLAQAITSLKRHFSGVQGRLVDHCRPAQRRFNVAITVAAGKDMDAIVVDTKETGYECIRHLREQRIGTATFLPLDSLQVPSLESQESARSFVANDLRYRLAADIISCDDAIKPAVLYAVGTTVVCDDLDCARELCFGGHSRDGHQQTRLKAVTLGGAVISKAGTMTGGVTNDDNNNNKAGRWAAAEIEKLRETKEKLENERSELDALADSIFGRSSSRRNGGSRGHSSRIEELNNNLGCLKNKQQYTQSDFNYTDKIRREKESQAKTLQRHVKKLAAGVATAEMVMSQLLEKAEIAKQNVKSAEAEHFGPFREKTGLKDFRAYEDAVGERRKEFNDQRRKILEHIAQAEQQKDYAAKRDFDKPIANLEKRIKDYKATLKTSKAKETTLEEQVEAAKEQLKQAEAEVKEATEGEKTFDETVQAAQSDYGDAQSARHKASKSVNAGVAQVERLRGSLHETLQKARVEEVELPMIDEAEMDGSDSEEESGTQAQSRCGSGGSKSNSMTQESMPHFSQADNAKVVTDKEAASKIDYSQLDAEMRQRPSDREERRMKKDFEDQLNTLASSIENTAPNMKAAEAFETVSQKLKHTNTYYEKALKESRKASAAFQKVKSQRAKLFNDAFNHIEESLKTIYTDMTKSSKHPLGGSAYLSLDDTEEPFKGGLKFNAMPPMKRFRDMEQLSGGEKTVAALSLLFAIHSYHPAPFFVMDEVDAALDNINLRKVCNYISHRSKTDFQCIVISLKDMFYERSESLVGVCKDVGTSSSRTLTLDLGAFEKNEKSGRKKRGAKRKAKSVMVATPAKRATRSSRRINASD